MCANQRGTKRRKRREEGVKQFNRKGTKSIFKNIYMD